MQLSYFPYDFHMHSNYSDGTLSPEELVDVVKERGIEHFALTDHDTTAGLARAKIQADKLGVKMTPGVEVSAEWNGKVIHILGLDVDAHDDTLKKLLEATQEHRYTRLMAIVDKLKRHRVDIAIDKFPKIEGVSYGRMHVAMALVEEEVVGKLGSGFKQYLARGKKGYIQTTWPSLQEVVLAILSSGGIPVIAHPRRYKIPFKRLTTLVADFHALGGSGIELATASQSPDDQRLIHSLAQRFNLLISQGSDFHHPGGYIQPGMTGGVPEGRYVWEAFS